MPDWNDVFELPYAERVPIYLEYLQWKPDDAAMWFNLGIAYKHLLQWRDCVHANQRALAVREDPEDPAWWNLGIAATALREWALARKAWRAYGLEIDGEEGPVSCDYGVAPVRLPHGEVVWGNRLDPARLIIRNVPMPEGGFRWGDIVLHDGSTNGRRRVEGRVYSVFDVLEKWSPSEIPTYRLSVTCPAVADSNALVTLFETNHFAAEDWSGNVSVLCQKCSTGDPDVEHEHAFAAAGEERDFGIASPKGLAETLLAEWVQSGAGRAHGLLEAV